MQSHKKYLKTIVPIFSDDKKIGIGFVIKNESNSSFVLTCRHVIHDNTEYKKSLFIGDEEHEEFKTKIDTTKVILGQGIDLAIIEVKTLENKQPFLLQEKEHNENLIIAAYSNIDSGAKSFIYKAIETSIEKHTALNHGKDYDAFLLEVEESLESGYSGAPLFDHNTNHVIGVLSIREGDDKGYAIDIKNLKDILPDIDILKLEDNTKNSYCEDTAQIVFNHMKEDEYKISINQEELFLNEAINIKEQQQTIIEEINDFINENEIDIIELILPYNLFSEDIGLWKDSSGSNLVDDCEIFIRDINRIRQSNKRKVKGKELWNSLLASCKTFEELSMKVSGCTLTRDKTKLSAYVSEKTGSDTPFEKIANHCNIAVWINDCDDKSKYSAFLSALFEETMDDFPSKFRGLLSGTSDNCANNVNLMWDNPNTLPKAYYE